MREYDVICSITARRRIRHFKYDQVLNKVIRGEALPQAMMDEFEKDRPGSEGTSMECSRISYGMF